MNCNGDSLSSAFLVERPSSSLHDIPTSPTLISRPIGAHGTAKFHAAEFGGDGEKEGWEDGREGRVLSERASFACGIKIRVPRYTVVLRSQTRPSGVLSRKDERRV